MPEQIDAPTTLRERIALATAAAMFAAGVILVTIILPAEYGVDPTGTGNWFGLTEMGQAATAAVTTQEGAGTALEPVRPGANTAQATSFRRNSMTFKLGPREGMEFKYKMAKGSAMVYTWTSTGVVNFDFHGEPEGAKKGYAESYEMGEKNSASGSFFAPTSGIHGWFWENTTDGDITLTLNAAGFMASAIEFRATGRTEHAIGE